MLDHTDECLAMSRLLAARRRYLDVRAALACDCALDMDLHQELTSVIRALDAKIDQIFAARAPA